MTLNFHSVRVRWAAAFVAVALALSASMAEAQAPAGRKLAIVVGNDTYPASPLVNARNDARAMAATLREVGFTVMLLEDATRNQMVARVAELSEALRPDDVAFFFYSGHGLQMEGENYLVPSDFEGTSVTAVRLTTLPVSEIQTAFSRAKASVIVLDACRNNPYMAARSGGVGLAAMEARGNIIAFATGAGQTASDNRAGANGLFTQHLLTALREPNLPLREIFYRARQRTYEASNGRQFPAVYDGLLGDIVLRPGAGDALPAPTYATAPPPAFAPPAYSAPPVNTAPQQTPAFARPGAAAAAPAYAPGVTTSATLPDGSMTFELLHDRTVERIITTSYYYDAGVLTIAPGRVKWSENGEVFYPGDPRRERGERGDLSDDFDATCNDIEHVRKVRKMSKVDRWQGQIRMGGRNYNFTAIELVKGKLAYTHPRPNVFEALKAACPSVIVK